MGMTSIYGLVDPKNGNIRYIGKSYRPEKRFKEHLYEASSHRTNNHKDNWIRGLLAAGLKPILKILDEVQSDGWEIVEKIS